MLCSGEHTKCCLEITALCFGGFALRVGQSLKAALHETHVTWSLNMGGPLVMGPLKGPLILYTMLRVKLPLDTSQQPTTRLG